MYAIRSYYARYVGFDLSDTMVDLSRRRLARFGRRAEVRLTDGSPRIDLEADASMTLKEKTVMKATTLTAIKRERAGKGAARAVRNQGLVPGVIYGDKQPPVLFSIDPRQLLAQMARPGS